VSRYNRRSVPFGHISSFVNVFGPSRRNSEETLAETTAYLELVHLSLGVKRLTLIVRCSKAGTL